MTKRNIIRNQISRNLLIRTIFLIIVFLSTYSCSSESGYNIFRFEKDDIRFPQGGIILDHPLFTFEYPRSFRYLTPNPHILYGDLTEVGFSQGRNYIYIYVDAHNLIPGETDAKSVIEKIINSPHSPNDEFHVIDRSYINISGQQAESLIYSFNMNTETFKKRVNRIVAFDYAGFIWKIEFACEEGQYKAFESGFQHLLDTFEFLPPYPEGLNSNT